MGNAAINSAVTHIETHYPSSELLRLLTAIRLEKLTGRLEVHFSQGSPAGEIKFVGPLNLIKARKE